jgi:hypothetical protein
LRGGASRKGKAVRLWCLEDNDDEHAAQNPTATSVRRRLPPPTRTSWRRPFPSSDTIT